MFPLRLIPHHQLERAHEDKRNEKRSPSKVKQETRGNRHYKIAKTFFKPKLVRRDRKDISNPLKEKNLPI